MEFVTLSRNGKTISARADMLDFYQHEGWATPGAQMAAETVIDYDPKPPTKPAPSIAEMRAWAVENKVPNVPERGKLPKHAIQAYLQAHKES